MKQNSMKQKFIFIPSNYNKISKDIKVITITSDSCCRLCYSWYWEGTVG